MRGLELIPTDDDDGDIFAFTLPERHDDELRQALIDDEDWYYNDPWEDDYLSDDYWD